MKACVDAISGRMDPEQFREALLRAAREEGIATLTVVRHGMEQTRPDWPMARQADWFYPAPEGDGIRSSDH